MLVNRYRKSVAFFYDHQMERINDPDPDKNIRKSICYFELLLFKMLYGKILFVSVSEVVSKIG
jgi:hypothetical protein